MCEDLALRCEEYDNRVCEEFGAELVLFFHKSSHSHAMKGFELNCTPIGCCLRSKGFFLRKNPSKSYQQINNCDEGPALSRRLFIHSMTFTSPQVLSNVYLVTSFLSQA